MAMTKEQLRQRNFELGSKMDELNSKATLTAEESAQYAQMEREMKKNTLAMQSLAAESQIREDAPKKSKNQMFRETVKAVREHKIDGNFQLRADSQNAITSGVVATGDLNNMESAGLPVTVKDLINPMEMGLIYDQVGVQIATGVHGQIQWPVLDTVAKVTVAGETVQLSATPIDFSKIVAHPVRLGISIEVDDEAINDAAFDLVACVQEQMNKALGRVLNEAVISTSKFNANFYGPLCNSKVQSITFADTTNHIPTYKELLQMKGKVLAKGADMVGFCYIMDAAMYSTLEATPKDTGSGLMIIENGKINGAPVFVTNLSAYANKVGAGCFGYAALNQHGDVRFIVDPYSLADKGVVKFTLNADWSLTTLQGTPFVVGA